MPLVVRELIVRATVVAEGPEEAPPPGGKKGNQGRNALVSEVVAEVLRILREQKER